MQYHAEMLSFVVCQRMKKPLTTAGNAMLSTYLECHFPGAPDWHLQEDNILPHLCISQPGQLWYRISSTKVAEKMQQSYLN
jgi:hypothetical protein